MISTISLLHEGRRSQPWVVRWYGDADSETGKQKRYGRSFRYSREAKEFLLEKRHEFERGAPRDMPVDVSLGSLLAEFEEARLAGLSFASQIGYRNTMTQLIEYFGRTRRIRDIQQRHAEAFLTSRKRCDGRPAELSSWSKARHLIHCRAIFGAAVKWGHAESNPFSCSRWCGNSSLRIKPKARPWHHLTLDEYGRLLVVVLEVRQRATHWLMYGCGLRAGEVYNLTTDRIDLKRRQVHIANRVATADAPPFVVKADCQSAESKERSVPIPQAAVPDLTEAMRQAFKSGGFLVLTPERFRRVQEHWRLCREGNPWGNHAWRPWQNRDMVNNVLRDTKAYLCKAGIELAAPFTLSTFRKSFAQNHADAGTPPRTLAKLLGHSNTRVTMEFYNRVTDANERAAAAAMDRLFAQQRKTKDAV